MFPPTYHASTILTTTVYVPLAQSSLFDRAPASLTSSYIEMIHG